MHIHTCLHMYIHIGISFICLMLKNLCFLYVSSEDHFCIMNAFKHSIDYRQFPLKCPILPSWKICFILRLFFSCFALRASQLKSVPNPPICSDSCLVAWFCGTPVFLGSRNLTPIVSLQVLLMFCPLGLPLPGADWSRVERTVLLSHLRQILFGHQCCCWFCGMDVLCFSVNPQVSF